jgi:hypothetical protein
MLMGIGEHCLFPVWEPTIKGKEKMYTVKGFKTGPSREFGPNGAYSFTIMRGKIKVAEVFEEGNGGEVDVHFYNKEEEKDFRKYAIENCKPIEGFEHLEPDLFGYIAQMAGEYEEEKRLKRICKTKTVVKLKGAKDGDYLVFKAPYSIAVKNIIVKKHDVEQFINERYI